MFKKPGADSSGDCPEKQDSEQEWTTTAFDGIYRKFRLPILKYVTRSVKNEGVAEELTQEIFLKAFRFKDSYKSKFKVSTWLWSIARNTVVDWKRKHQNSPALFYAHSHEVPYDIEQAADMGHCIERTLTDREDREALLALTLSLTEMQRKVLFMRVLDQLTYLEISRKLDLTLSAVKCLFFRAKATLTSGVSGNAPESWGPGLKVEFPEIPGEFEDSDTPNQRD
jgi:RNA polymerase sigma-70 factor (ECF subfamily)